MEIRKRKLWIWLVRNFKFLIIKLIGLTALQTALDCKQAHTSFGKLPLSVEKSKPLFSKSNVFYSS